MDLSLTVSLVEAKYAKGGRRRPPFPARSMLLALMFMCFEAISSVRKLERRQYAREICEFGDRMPKHNTFSLFITRAGPETIEKLFDDFRDQAFIMGNGPFRGCYGLHQQHIHEGLFQAKQKGGISDRGVRVGRVDRRSYKLGWRAHTFVSIKALPITYIVKAANETTRFLLSH
jgi:hypothetical protein